MGGKGKGLSLFSLVNERDVGDRAAKELLLLPSDLSMSAPCEQAGDEVQNRLRNEKPHPEAEAKQEVVKCFVHGSFLLWKV